MPEMTTVISVRTDRKTRDGRFVLVYSTKGKSPTRFDYHWVEIESGVSASPKFEKESTATYWQEGYEIALSIKQGRADES